jgi:hypothetical protein
MFFKLLKTKWDFLISKDRYGASIVVKIFIQVCVRIGPILKKWMEWDLKLIKKS